MLNEGKPLNGGPVSPKARVRKENPVGVLARQMCVSALHEAVSHV